MKKYSNLIKNHSKKKDYRGKNQLMFQHYKKIKNMNKVLEFQNGKIVKNHKILIDTKHLRNNEKTFLLKLGICQNM